MYEIVSLVVVGVRRVVFVVVLALALLATSCSSSDGPTDIAASDPTAGQAGGSTSPGPTEPVDGGSSVGASEDGADVQADIARTDDAETRNDAYVSPVFDAVGIDPNDQLEAQNVFVRNAEELVRQCMADAGFAYVPSIPSAGPSTQQLWELSASISGEQFTAEYGYGIATLLELDFFDEGVLAFVEIVLGPPPTEARSQGAQAAYELALSGETVQGLTAEEVQEQTSNALGPSADGSCRSYGYQNADNALGDKFDGLFALLGDDLDTMNERVENDPRIRDITAAWQTCMAGFGYAYENTQEIVDELQNEADSLRNQFQGSPEALTIFQAAAEANLATMNADERYTFLEQVGAFQGFAMVPSLQADLDALIQRELTIAGHDAECADVDTFLAVQLEYEQAFVEEHAAQLSLIAAGQAE